MPNFLPYIIDQYGDRLQLIQSGVWGGNLYKLPNGNLRYFDSKTRGWIWKTLVLHPEVDTNDIDLVPIPILPLVDANKQNSQTEHINSKNDIRNLTKPIVRFSHTIRKLTPVQTLFDPLKNNDRQDNEIDDLGSMKSHDAMNLHDTLDIIDLDLSRLILDVIFQEPIVHAQMRQILFSYLAKDYCFQLANNYHNNGSYDYNNGSDYVNNFVSNPDDNINQLMISGTYYYKQGYHEILGMIFLQLYDDTNDGPKENKDVDMTVSNTRNFTTDRNTMKNILIIYSKLMDQIIPVFYNEEGLMNWEKNEFAKMLEVSSKPLHKIFYETNQTNENDNHHKHSNLIWLIRWTRLLLMRELPRDSVLIIWDHLLTFTYPIKTFMSSLIILILLKLDKKLTSIYKDYNNDLDEIIELLLHIDKEKIIHDINFVELCQVAGQMTELWLNKRFNDFQLAIKRVSFVMDPNRKRMEDKLKERVQKSLNK